MGLFEFHKEISQHTLAIGTQNHYEVSKRYYKEFIKKYYNKSDVYLSQLNLKFITDFDQYILQNNTTNKINPCNNNTRMKYIERLRNVVNIAISNDWLEKDPFARFKVSYTLTKSEILSAEELQKLEEKEFAFNCLQVLKDLFLFSCYTGLAYIDPINLKPDNITMGIDKELRIRTSITKTSIPLNVPIIPKAADILKKYESDPILKELNRVLPCISNQRLNAYLKEVADFCGIKKLYPFTSLVIPLLQQ